MLFKNMGDMICDRRKAKNMTQKDLADELHVTDKAVSKWERDIACPDEAGFPKRRQHIHCESPAAVKNLLDNEKENERYACISSQ